MIPIRNKKKTLEVTVEEMRNFAFTYVEKYAPSKQQLKTYLLKKYLKISNEDVKKKDVKLLKSFTDWKYKYCARDQKLHFKKNYFDMGKVRFP